jgi:hypothetical protein
VKIRNFSVIAALLLLCTACSAQVDSSRTHNSEPKGASPVGEDGERLPSDLRMVIAQVGNDLWVMIRNEGPGTARVPGLVSLHSPFRTVSLDVSPLPEGATTILASSGYVMPGGQLDSFVELPPKRMYGASYSIEKLAKAMRLESGCYAFAATYQTPEGLKGAPDAVSPSTPANVCF